MNRLVTWRGSNGKGSVSGAVVAGFPVLELEKTWLGNRSRRRAVLKVGREPENGPSLHARFRVSVDHSKAMVRRTTFHFEIGRNRFWVFDLTIEPPLWLEDGK